MSAVEAINQLIGLLQRHINIEAKKSRKWNKNKQKDKKEKKIVPLQFVEIGNNKLSCSHCPTNQLIKYWYDEQNVTDIVTLLRSDESKCRSVRDKCKSLNIHWHHLPISGAKKLCASVPKKGFDVVKENSDIISLKGIKTIANILKTVSKPRIIVLHCAAGQHRTGLMMYLILRNIGYDKQKTSEAINKVRPVTYKELIKVRRENTWFHQENVKTLVDFAESYIKYNNTNHQ
eukprot:169786_1